MKKPSKNIALAMMFEDDFEIADAIKNKSNELGLDINDIDKRLH